MLILYNLFIALYSLAAQLAAFWSPKAKEWVDGRKRWAENLEERLDNNNSWLWVHCASAGEFEQGKPVIEQLKNAYPGYKILVTFFSPSGYAVGKKYKYADHICFLPLDSKQNATRFIQIVKPKLVVFVKYDYWYYFLKAIKENNTPLLLVSAIFRDSQPFFKWYGSLHRKMLSFFSYLFVQDQSSSELLQSINVHHCIVSGDTRFDRVAALAQNNTALDLIQSFTANSRIMVAGSTWPEDEEMIKAAIDDFRAIKIIIAPHEIDTAHISSLTKLFPDAVKYSELNEKGISNSPVLIIDNVGMLSRLYKYAFITYIGGGFNKSGIHDTLEAAVWGKPVLFGPNYHKFKEARDLIELKAAYSVTDADSLKERLQQPLTDEKGWQQSAGAAKNYVHQQQGATTILINYIQEKRLLTN